MTLANAPYVPTRAQLLAVVVTGERGQPSTPKTSQRTSNPSP